ncbi:MAG TPA: CARDB domain-containing protein [Candidatus Paceibacterota bacterium]|nr:CARDB domain-containing protein [Candidatus Paceibacterota bacterium]HPT18052.1 CARDB domain-containing protein [Candidatus Paceibacterota bacterium]
MKLHKVFNFLLVFVFIFLFSSFCLVNFTNADTVDLGCNPKSGACASGTVELFQTIFFPGVPITFFSDMSSTGTPASSSASSKVTTETEHTIFSGAFSPTVDYLDGVYVGATPSIAGVYDAIFNLMAFGLYGSDTISYIVVNAPTINIAATPSTIGAGNSSTISWTSTGATSCNLSGNGISGSGTSNSGVSTGVINTAGAYTYTLSCLNEGGSVSSAVIVNVIASPTVTVIATPSTIDPKESSTISWTSTGADVCDSGGHGTGKTGSFVVTPATSTSYSVSCTRNQQVTSPGCSGSYVATPGYCNRYRVPQEADYGQCNSSTNTEEQCYGTYGGYHHCSWVDAVTNSCSGFNFTECSNHSGCSYDSGTNVPSATATGSALVTISGPTVDIGTYDTNGVAISSIPPNQQFTVHWSSTNATYCDLVSPSSPLPVNYTTSCTYPRQNCTFTDQITSATTYSVLCHSAQSTADDSTYIDIISKPDLTINTSCTPVSAEAGQETTLVCKVKNIGNKETGPTGSQFSNFFQISLTDPEQKQSTFNHKKSLIGSIFTKVFAEEGGGTVGEYINLPSTKMNALLAGQSSNTIAKYTFSPEGTYYFRACADKTEPANAGVVSESNENNNCGPWTTITATSSVSKPDLTINTYGTPTSAQPNVSVKLSSTVKNIGSASTGASFYNFFQISTNASASIQKNNILTNLLPKAYADNTPIENLPATLMPELDSQASNITNANYTFGSTGTYYFRACADKTGPANTGTIDESNENNNCGHWTTIVISNNSQLPDLTASSVTPTSVDVGVNTSFSSTISNIGSVSTGQGFYNFIQFSTDGTTFTDVTPATWMNALGSGQSNVMTKSHTFTTAGKYYARICADKSNSSDTNGDIVESNENNNCGHLATITVGDGSQTSMSVNLSAEPMTMVLPTNTTKLIWVVSGSPDRCTASGEWSGSKSASDGTHTESISGLTLGTHTFKITCEKTNFANSTSSISVNVVKEGEKVDGVCGTELFSCLAGYSTNQDETKLTWDCEGINGGATVSCSSSGSSSCSNGIQDGEETGIDCGGPDCKACKKIQKYIER